MMNLKPSGTQCFPKVTCQVEVQYTQQVELLLLQNLGAWNPTSHLPSSLDVPQNKQASIPPMKRRIPLPDATCFSSKLFCIQRKYNQWKNITMVIVLPWPKLDAYFLANFFTYIQVPVTNFKFSSNKSINWNVAKEESMPSLYDCTSWEGVDALKG